MQPAGAPLTFDEDFMADWSLWVVEHGLPDLPEEVRKGESVPVARWAGPRYAAVLHVQWMWGHDDPSEDYLASGIDCLVRAGDRWESTDGGGGTGWPSARLVRPGDIAPRQVRRLGLHGESGVAYACSVAYGVAGTDAAYVELVTGPGTQRWDLESPTGAWVVGWESTLPAEVRILDDSSQLLAVESFLATSS
jgi:hypothetical protein